MYHQKTYNDNHWKLQIQLANSVFAEGNLASSVHHYQYALTIAKQLFIEFQIVEPLPETLTHTLVISYLNLADCWAAQNKKKQQILCLIESYDFLKALIKDHSISQSLRHQTYSGVRKVYSELCLCFKEIDASDLLYKTEEDYSELSMLYQAQLCVIH